MTGHQTFGESALGELRQVFPEETAYFLSIRQGTESSTAFNHVTGVDHPIDTIRSFVRPSETDALRRFLPTLGKLSLESVLDDIGSITATEMYDTLERTGSMMTGLVGRNTAEAVQLENRLQAKHWPLEQSRSIILGNQLKTTVDFMSPAKVRESNIARYASRVWLDELPASERAQAQAKVSICLEYVLSNSLLEIDSLLEQSNDFGARRNKHTVSTVFEQREKAANGIIQFAFMAFPMSVGEAMPIRRLLQKLN